MLPVLLALLAQAPADSTGPDIVYYGGTRVFFFAKQEAVVLLDSAWVRYQGMSVHSDSIHYDVKLHRLTAYGDVLFSSGSENITGTMLLYDIDSRKGMMRTAHTRVENGFFRAGEVWLVRERVLDARQADYTTCDREHPHYVFYGPRAKLFMDDVAISEPVIFKVGRVPVLAAPFWLVPVASRRKSGLLPFKIGNSSTEGLYSKNIAYYWVINDYSDLTVYADLMTKKGLQTRVEGIYIVNPYATGSLEGAYIQEWDTRHRRYSFNAVHRSERFFFGTQLDAQTDIVSDQTYVPDYSEERIDWLKQDARSFAQVSRQFRGVGSFSARAEQYQDFVRRTRVTDLPVIRLGLGTRRLVGGWNASPSVSASNRLEGYADSTGAETLNVKTRRGGANVGISSPQYSLGQLGSLTLSENLGWSELRTYDNNIIDQRSRTVTSGLAANTDQRFLGSFYTTEGVSMGQSDNLLDSQPVTATYSAGVSARTTLYRVFSAEPLGLEGLLHSATPGVGFTYAPRVDPAGIFGRPRFDTTPASAGLNLSFRNTFQGKLDTLGTKRDFGSMDFTSSYDLIGRRLTPLIATAGFQPLQSSRLNLRVDAQAGYDFDSMALRKDYSVNTSFYLNRIGTDTARHSDRGFQVGLNHTLGRDASSNATNMLRATAALAGFGWRLTLTNIGYNFAQTEQQRLTDYSVIIWRDLHCWEANVSIQKLGAKWKYDFEIHIKKLQDIKVGKSLFQPILPSFLQ